MRGWIFSDTHIPNVDHPIQQVFPTIPEADLCICAGDIVESDPVASVCWLAQHIRPHMQVVFVMGNHEFYNLESTMERDRERARIAAIQFDIDLLDDAAVTIDGVLFAGTTLWSDFAILAGDDLAKRENAMAEAGRGLNDFRLIRTRENSSETWTPHLARMQHFQSRYWLDQVLASHIGPRVVVSHHAPHPLSIAPEFAKDPVTAAFVSDLSDVIMRNQPNLWIHGHTHSSFNYSIGVTKVRCNPKGYRHERVAGYDPGLIVEI
ncbi:metallophosphoesterase [Devosia sp.]|uniref:metallophosphoesterase n=1 Tax=Devosia sp. TaxID=1871048 RepID=UPI0025EA082E|nr:metallophosphoesterase [Devosia sp.]MCR6634736.1 metallophosphoesterase [Devosia sp.]